MIIDTDEDDRYVLHILHLQVNLVSFHELIQIRQMQQPVRTAKLIVMIGKIARERISS